MYMFIIFGKVSCSVPKPSFFNRKFEGVIGQQTSCMNLIMHSSWSLASSYLQCLNLVNTFLHFSPPPVPLVDNLHGEVRGRIHHRGPSVSSASSEDVSINRIAEEDNNSGSDSSNAIPHSSASGGQACKRVGGACMVLASSLIKIIQYHFCTLDKYYYSYIYIFLYSVIITGSTHSFSPTGRPGETKLPPLSKRERERERERER